MTLDARYHRLALVESQDVGEGTVVHAFAHVMAGATVGRHCKLGDHVFVETGAIVGDHVTIKNGVAIWAHVHVGDSVFLGPGVALTNDRHPRAGEAWEPVATHIHEGATIGANATIVCGVTVGRRSFVGAGAVVTHDVLPYALVTGNPARQHGWVCDCGRPLAVGEEVACVCGRRFAVSGECRVELRVPEGR